MESMRHLKLPILYQKLSGGNSSDFYSLLFSSVWEGDRSFEKKVLRWLFIHHPLELKKYIHYIPENGTWGDLMELLFDISDYKTLKNEFSASFCVEKCREVQQEILNIIVDRIRRDYTLMMKGEECSECAVYVDKTLFSTIAKFIGVDIGEFRRVYITPLRAYINLMKMDYKNWAKVPSIAVRRWCTKF